MFVTLALAVMLNAAGPVCQALCPDPLCEKVCGPPEEIAQLQACQKDLKERELDVDFCKATVKRVLQSREDMGKALGQCLYDKWKCEAKKPIKKIGKKTSTKVVVKPQENVKQEQKQEQSQQVIVNVIVNQDRQKDRQVERPAKPFPLGIGARGAIGLMACDPPVFGLVGVRGRLLPAHLGLELNTQFAYGHSAQLMVYPVQGPIAWHLDFGALLFMRDGAQVNLLGGTGVEVQVVPHFSITADWRVTFPKNPNLGAQLLRSQLTLGLMLHTW